MAKRVDRNQPKIVKELRDLGYSVAITSDLGRGFPDIVVGYAGLNILVELKADGKKKLTDDEEKFFSDWQGQVNKCCTTQEILQAIRLAIINIIFDQNKIFSKLGVGFLLPTEILALPTKERDEYVRKSFESFDFADDEE